MLQPKRTKFRKAHKGRIHGLAKGSYLGIKRIMSCHPFKILGGGFGLNFVPKKKIIKEKNNGQ